MVFMSVAMVLAMAIPAMAREKSVGVFGGISTRTNAPVAGISFGLELIPHLRITPSVQYQFPRHDIDAFMLNVDIQSPWQIVGSAVKVYPLVGVAVSRWNENYGEDSDKRHFDRLGFNVGGGIEWKPSKLLGLKLFAEGKYGYAQRFDTGVVTIGLGYVF